MLPLLPELKCEGKEGVRHGGEGEGGRNLGRGQHMEENARQGERRRDRLKEGRPGTSEREKEGGVWRDPYPNF